MKNAKLLNEMELDSIVGGFSSEVTMEAEGYVGKEVFLVQKCGDGHLNFTKVKLLGATPKSNPQGDTMVISYQVTADPDDFMETNMPAFSSGSKELGDKWRIYLDY